MTNQDIISELRSFTAKTTTSWASLKRQKQTLQRTYVIN